MKNPERCKGLKVRLSNGLEGTLYNIYNPKVAWIKNELIAEWKKTFAEHAQPLPADYHVLEAKPGGVRVHLVFCAPPAVEGLGRCLEKNLDEALLFVRNYAYQGKLYSILDPCGAAVRNAVKHRMSPRIATLVCQGPWPPEAPKTQPCPEQTQGRNNS